MASTKEDAQSVNTLFDLLMRVTDCDMKQAAEFSWMLFTLTAHVAYGDRLMEETDDLMARAEAKLTAIQQLVTEQLFGQSVITLPTNSKLTH